MRCAIALVDAMGVSHARVAPQSGVRIVSLVPSITELLCDLGLAKWLVGRTGFCIHPAATVAAIPKVGGTKDVNIGKIRQLAPTHLIVNIDENEKPTVDALAAFVPHIIVTHPLSPHDNLALFALLGGIFGAKACAEKLSGQFNAELALTKVAAINPQRVLYCIWQDPWMTVARDTYIAAMLSLIGWQQWQAPSDTLSSKSGKNRYPQFEWSQALVDEVDLVLLSSEPYHFTDTHADTLEKQIGKPVRLVDGEMLSWYGSRAIAGLQYVRTLAAEA